MAGFIPVFSAVHHWLQQWKNYWNRSVFAKVIHKRITGSLLFLTHPVYSAWKRTNMDGCTCITNDVFCILYIPIYCIALKFSLLIIIAVFCYVYLFRKLKRLLLTSLLCWWSSNKAIRPLYAGCELVYVVDTGTQPVWIFSDQRHKNFHLKPDDLHQSALAVCTLLQTVQLATVEGINLIKRM